MPEANIPQQNNAFDCGVFVLAYALCAIAKRRVEDAFSVKLHERTIGKHLAKHGFRRFSVRLEHPKTDPAAQQAFKKTLPAS